MQKYLDKKESSLEERERNYWWNGNRQNFEENEISDVNKCERNDQKKWN